MFYRSNDSDFREVLPGIRIKTLVYGEKTLLAEFRMDAGSKLPDHAHMHEQTGYLVEGKIRLSIGHETFEAEKGDSWCIPGGTKHSAEILKDSMAIEVFFPVREDYLPK